MKLRNLLFFTLLLLSVNVVAQHGRRGTTRIQAYPALGMTLSQMEGDNLKGFKKLGFTGGVGAVVPFDRYQTLLLDVSASYSQRGAREASSSYLTPYRLTEFSLNYVDVPLMFYYRDPKSNLQLGLGLSLSRLVQQPHGYLESNPYGVVPDTSDLSFLHNDVAVVGGVRIKIWKHLKLDVRAQYSLLPVKRDWHFTDYQVAGHVGEAVEEYNNCYNFSVQTRLVYLFGEPEHFKNRRKRR